MALLRRFQFAPQIDEDNDGEEIDLCYMEVDDESSSDDSRPLNIPPIFVDNSSPYQFKPVRKSKPRWYERLEVHETKRLFDLTLDFFESHTPSAEERRQNNKLKVIGGSVPGLRTHWNKEAPEIMKRIEDLGIKLDSNCIR